MLFRAGEGLELHQGTVAAIAQRLEDEEHSGVIAMMDLLLKDLAKQITEIETEYELRKEARAGR